MNTKGLKRTHIRTHPAKKSTDSNARDFREFRQNQILEHLQKHGTVAVNILAETFQVDPMTIRRDLEELARKRLVVRTHGGAIKNRVIDREFGFREKEERNLELKTEIATKAVQLLQPCDSVFFDTGTTTRTLVAHLPLDIVLTIVTNNLLIVADCLYRESLKVIVPGGEVNPLSPDLYGALTVSNLRDINVRKAFIGCDAFDDKGFYTSDLKSAETIRVLLSNASEKYLVADSTKSSFRGLIRIADISEVAIITDSKLPQEVKKAFKKKRIVVL